METLLIGVVIFLSSLLQGMFGFAFVLIALPLLSLFLTMKVTVPLLSLFLALIAGIMTFQLKREFSYRKIMPLIIGAVFGIPFGIYFFLASSEQLIKFTLGLVLIAYTAYCFQRKAQHWQLPAWTGYLVGLFAGSLGGAFNITGPPVVIYLSLQTGSKLNIFASLNFFFFITSILVVLFHLAAGNITVDIALTFLKFTPAMMIGLMAGRYLFRKIPEEKYKSSLNLLLLVMGIMLVTQSFLPKKI
jgi:uncharacterized membrane protein YfcA